MRLVYLLLSPTFGMHQYTSDLANRMIKYHEVHLVTTDGYPADRYSPSVKIHLPVKVSNTGLSLEGLRLGQFSSVIQVLRKVKPDLVHMTGPHLWNVALAFWLRQKDIPIVHTIHDLDPHYGGSYSWFLHIWNGLVIRASDHILVHGECYRNRLLDQGLAPVRVTMTGFRK